MTTIARPTAAQSQAFLIGERQVEVRETAVPEPGPDQVLIEVAAVGICGSDRRREALTGSAPIAG
jgi:L-iditol 2-dehydrogenase